MRAARFAFAALGFALLGAFGAAATVHRLPSGVTLAVIDGDTIEIDGIAADIAGIDAPEISQLCRRHGEIHRCGLDAAFALDKIVSLDALYLACTPIGDDGRVRCAVGQEDLGLRLIEDGYAVATADAPPAYAEAAARAAEIGMGIWGSDFVPPERWRAGERLDPELAAATRCLVKGVVESRGRRYLVPTDPDYERVTVDPALGGRLFCSDEEARAAGFRHRLDGP